MRNKIICLLALSSLVFSSCKKEAGTAPGGPNTVKDTTPEIMRPTNEEIPVSAQEPTQMTFTEMEHDFGTIKQGEKVMHVFTFKNTGEHDLKIARAMGSCGCTVPEFPKEPIAPGKTGKMKVSFNSKGKSGPQHKTVTVYANVPNEVVVLNITAKVLAPEPPKKLIPIPTKN